jgi:hypothetical protein
LTASVVVADEVLVGCMAGAEAGSDTGPAGPPIPPATSPPDEAWVVGGGATVRALAIRSTGISAPSADGVVGRLTRVAPGRSSTVDGRGERLKASGAPARPPKR